MELQQFKNNSSWREHIISVEPESIYTLNFRDTKPNMFYIQNPNSVKLHVSISKIPTEKNYEFSVMENSTKALGRPTPTSYLYIYNKGNVPASVTVYSIADKFDLSILDSVSLNVEGITVDVTEQLEIKGFTDSVQLPSGRNVIGKVGLDSDEFGNLNSLTQNALIMKDTLTCVKDELEELNRGITTEINGDVVVNSDSFLYSKVESITREFPLMGYFDYSTYNAVNINDVSENYYVQTCQLNLLDSDGNDLGYTTFDYAGNMLAYEYYKDDVKQRGSRTGLSDVRYPQDAIVPYIQFKEMLNALRILKLDNVKYVFHSSGSVLFAYNIVTHSRKTYGGMLAGLNRNIVVPSCTYMFNIGMDGEAEKRIVHPDSQVDFPVPCADSIKYIKCSGEIPVKVKIYYTFDKYIEQSIEPSGSIGEFNFPIYEIDIEQANAEDLGTSTVNIYGGYYE